MGASGVATAAVAATRRGARSTGTKRTQQVVRLAQREGLARLTTLAQAGFIAWAGGNWNLQSRDFFFKMKLLVKWGILTTMDRQITPLELKMALWT